MKPLNLKLMSASALVLAGVLAMNPVMAEKPSWAGGGKSDRNERNDKGGDKSERNERHERNERSDKGENRKGGEREHFEGRHNALVRDYYDSHYRDGRCPPGLAKKNNGCLPPGQAKKWNIGQPLPRDVVYYTVPRELVLQIGQPPQGYRYVRVASDILMMSTGTRMIVDAIRDLGRI